MNIKNFLMIIFFILIILSIIGCIPSSGALMKLELDMNKKQVINILGNPEAARGSMRNKYDQTIEVWEYLIQKQGEFGGTLATYWLYFYNGRLVQWGEAGDWRREADRIYEMRFR